jgi:uncharacterized hydrophobic protein (TIGR00271 family)
MNNYYIYADKFEKFALKVLKYIEEKGEVLHLVEIDKLHELTLDGHLIVTGSTDEIKEVMRYAYEHNMSMGIIPLPEQKELKNTFLFSSNFEKSINSALEVSEKKIDLLYCNNELVLQEVVIGEVPPLDSFSSSLDSKSLKERIKSSFGIFSKVKNLSHTNFTVTTAKDKVLKFSAVGAVGIEYNNCTFASKLISKYLKFNDARLTLVVLSPSSILQYMGYIFQSYILKQTPETLPSSVGYIHSSVLKIESEKPLNIIVDRRESSITTPIILESRAEALALSVSNEFWEKSAKTKEIKESIKVEHLPSDKEMSAYLGKSIPLFSHASQEQFSALFSNLREESRLNSTFMTLLILATIIATFGLYINSASVIIGAMLLAPLMQPIVGLSMGLLRQDITLLLNGAKSIAIGVLAVIFSAVILAWLLPLEQLTSEMNGRLSPTILDMFVAIISGVAGAYAKSNEKIVGSLAGVAIAVALVPPLAVSGIGLGWQEWSMFGSALLLFITNLVGIILSASLTFLVLGYSPISVAKKGISYALILVAIVSIPLYISFKQMKHDIDIQQQLLAFNTTIGSKHIYLTNVTTQAKEVRCEVISSDILSSEEKKTLKRSIVKKLGEEVRIIVSFGYEL